MPEPPPSDLGSDVMGWPAIALDDVAAVAVAAGCIGGCVLLGLAVGPLPGVGLFCLLLVLWGGYVLASRVPEVGEGGDLGAHGDERQPQAG